jgi:glutamine---fructose-6-phosphate transaminase (isomerizing)
LLACTSLAAKILLPADLVSIYGQAESQARNVVKKIHTNKYFLLGDGILYPVAVYGALKFNEVFGARANPYSTEEFCHSPLFSLKKDDQIILLEEASGRTRG